MPITQIRRQRGKVCRKMLSEPGGIGAGPLCREQRGVAARAGGARRSEAALGLGSWDYGWIFFFGFGSSQILFCLLNTNGRGDLNRLECWAETSKKKWSWEACKILSFA